MEKEFPPMFRYLPVMKEFMTMGSVRLGEMEDLFTDMKSRVRRAQGSTPVYRKNMSPLTFIDIFCYVFVVLFQLFSDTINFSNST
jgi:hypothetical protein